MAGKPDIPAALLQFETQIQAGGTAREVAFVAVNESFSALRFDQAVIWKHDLFGSPIVTAASGLTDVMLDSPYVQWLARAIRSFPRGSDKVRRVQLSGLPEAIGSEGSEWCPEHLLVCQLAGPDGESRGGLLFTRSEAFSDVELSVAEWIARSTGYGLWAWRSGSRRFWRRLGGRRAKIALAAGGLMVAAIGAIPVQLNALAPAEITPQNPIPVTAPVQGIVKEVLVRPNQIVSAAQAVAVLDDTALRNQLAVAQKALEIARADSQRAVNKAFGDEASRAELQLLMARVRERSAEAAFVSDQLDRLTINVPQGGIAIFAGANELKGKLVQPGERLMTIADPSLIRATFYVAPDDAIQLEAGADARVFLNVDPLNPLRARITRSSYEALPQPDGSIAYVVQAELLEGHGFPRIGLRGTAKIYAEQVSLAYYIFRKPLAFLRQRVGL